MSGLLDKASAAKKAEEAEEPPKKKELDGKAVEMKADGKIRNLEGEPNAHLAMQISLAGWVIILVGALLSLQGGSWGLAVVSVVLVIGIGAIVYADRMKGSVSTPKLAASVVVAVLIVYVVAGGRLAMGRIIPLDVCCRWAAVGDVIHERIVVDANCELKGFRVVVSRMHSLLH